MLRQPVEWNATDGGTLQQRVEVKYDAFGNRVEKKVDADGNGGYETTQRYAVEGFNPAKPAPIGNENWDVWADLDGSSSLTTRYLRGDAVDQVFAHIAFSGGSSTSASYLTDHLGSIRDIVNSSGNVVDTIVYDGFGNITSETDSTKRARYAWTGREYDVEVGLQYNRARYYDARTGRWAKSKGTRTFFRPP